MTNELIPDRTPLTIRMADPETHPSTCGCSFCTPRDQSVQELESERVHLDSLNASLMADVEALKGALRALLDAAETASGTGETIEAYYEARNAALRLLS